MLPTILGLCGLEIPETVQGEDFSDYIVLSGEGGDPSGGAALLQCAHPFGEWTRKQGTCTARKKTHRSFAIFQAKNAIILPRQARDEHREGKSQKRDVRFFAGSSKADLSNGREYRGLRTLTHTYASQPASQPASQLTTCSPHQNKFRGHA